MPHVTSQRERDSAVILNVIRNLGPVSRVEIHHLTRLRTSTISQLTKALLQEGKLTTAGLSDNPTGRKQILLRINEEQGFLLAIEFDSEFVTAACTDLAPNIRALIREKTNREEGIEGLVAQLKRCSWRALEEAGVPPGKLNGIGIADVGLVNRRTGVTIMTSQLDFWRNVPLAKEFEKEFGVPTFVDNATRCRGNAERVLGGSKAADDMIFIEYGGGIGSAIFLKGKVVDGHRTSAGEFGHTRVTLSGPPCHCGSFGCLEAVCGIHALATRFREIIREGGSSLATSMAGGNASAVTGWVILDAARRGDKVCSTIAEEMIRYFALGLGNLVNLLDPAAIVLDRRLEIAGPVFLQQLTRAIRLQSLSYLTEDLEIRYGSLGPEAGVLGAALLVVEQLFAIPDLKPPRFLLEPEAASERRHSDARAATVRT